MSCVDFRWPTHCSFNPVVKGQVATATNAWMPGVPQLGPPQGWDHFTPPIEYQTLNQCSMS